MNWIHAAVLLFGVSIGWTANGWRLNGDIADMKLGMANQAETLRLAAQSKVSKAGTQFAEKAAKDRVITQVIIKEVDRYVPNSLPMLPGDFRLYHDAAAAGTQVDDSRRADAAPVSPRTVAATVAENYANSRYDQSRLEALQQIVKASGCFDVEE